MIDYRHLYKKELLENIIPFWTKYSPDTKYGGYFTCLDRKGSVYDTDKFVWLQARQVWMYATLYRTVEKRKEWLEIAEMGAEFLIKHGRNHQGYWYFSLNRKGQPIVEPYNIFSDCFAALAFGSLSKATKNSDYTNIATDTFNQILKRRLNPKGIYNKSVPETRPLKNFALPMILSNLALELEGLIPDTLSNQLTTEVINEVLNDFYCTGKDVILENVAPDGAYINSFEGRLINPGHAIEAMWFILDVGKKRNDSKLIQRATELGLKMLNYGWDKEKGGIFYFMDVEGHPPQQLEWDQKLWWVHLESMVFLAKAYALKKDENISKWFEKLHHYTWRSFKDPDYQEWYGYLNRNGEILLPLKGGKWKGCFHVPRAMLQIWQTLESISAPKKSIKESLSDKNI